MTVGYLVKARVEKADDSPGHRVEQFGAIESGLEIFMSSIPSAELTEVGARRDPSNRVVLRMARFARRSVGGRFRPRRRSRTGRGESKVKAGPHNHSHSGVWDLVRRDPLVPCSPMNGHCPRRRGLPGLSRRHSEAHVGQFVQSLRGAREVDLAGPRCAALSTQPVLDRLFEELLQADPVAADEKAAGGLERRGERGHAGMGVRRPSTLHFDGGEA